MRGGAGELHVLEGVAPDKLAEPRGEDAPDVVDEHSCGDVACCYAMPVAENGCLYDGG